MASHVLFRQFPPLRFPAFLMGVLGGVYTRKVQNGEIDNETYSNTLLLPISIIQLHFYIPHRYQSNKSQANPWRLRTDFCIGVLIVSFLAMLILVHIDTHQWFQIWNLIIYLRQQQFVFYRNSPSNSPLNVLTYQYILLPFYVIALVGLCLDQNESYASKIFGIRLFRWMGKVSLPLYLIHGPIHLLVGLVVQRLLIFSITNLITLIFFPILASYLFKMTLDDPLQRHLNRTNRKR